MGETSILGRLEGLFGLGFTVLGLGQGSLPASRQRSLQRSLEGVFCTGSLRGTDNHRHNGNPKP